MRRWHPNQFISSVTKPDDFDTFQGQVQAEPDAIPLDPAMRHVPERSTPDVDVFDIHCTSLNSVQITGQGFDPKSDYELTQFPLLGSHIRIRSRADIAEVNTISGTGTFWYRIMEISGTTDAYAFEEINVYAPAWSDQQETVSRTQAYVNPQHQAQEEKIAPR